MSNFNDRQNNYPRNMNNPGMNNQNTNNPNMNNPDSNNQPFQPKFNRKKWGLSQLNNNSSSSNITNNNNNNLDSNNSVNNNNNNINNNNNSFNDRNKFQNEARHFDNPPPQSNRNNQSDFNNNYRKQENYGNDQGNSYRYDRNQPYNGYDNRYNSYDRRNEREMPPNYHHSHHPNEQDYYGHSNHYNYHYNDHNRNDYDIDRDRYRRHDSYERFGRDEDYDRNRYRQDDRFDSRYRNDDRDEGHTKLRRYPSSSSNSSASISGSSSTNIHRTNSLPKSKLQPPKAPAPPESPPILVSPPQLISESSDNDDLSPLNEPDSDEILKKAPSNNLSNNNMVSRHEVADQPINVSELPATLKKLTQSATQDLFISDKPQNKEVSFSKPKKKVSLISSSNSTINPHNILESESRSKKQIDGLTPINKKSSQNYSTFENGISPFPDIKKAGRSSEKLKIYETLSINSKDNIKEWIDQKLFNNNENLNDQNNEDYKISQMNENSLDFIDFIHEFNLDEEILRRNDWQKNPEPLVRKISEAEFDLHKNNEPIEAFIIKDQNDPYFYNVNLFTLQPVKTEEEKINDLLKKFNLPDIHNYINDQNNRIDEEKQKAIKKLK